MRRVMRSLGIAAAAAAVLSVVACAPVRVNASLERGMDFTQCHSYTWAAGDRFSTGDPRLDNNEFFENRLKADVDRVLGAPGGSSRRARHGGPERALSRQCHPADRRERARSEVRLPAPTVIPVCMTPA